MQSVINHENDVYLGSFSAKRFNSGTRFLWYYYSALTIAAVWELREIVTFAGFAALAEGSVFPVALSLGAWFCLRPKGLEFVELRSDRVVVEQPRLKTEFKFEEIAAVYFSTHPSGKLSFSIESIDGRDHSFDSVLEESEQILEVIADHRPGLIDQRRIGIYRKNALMFERVAARSRQSLKQWHWIAFRYFLFPVFISASMSLVSVHHLNARFFDSSPIFIAINAMISYIFMCFEGMVRAQKVKKLSLAELQKIRGNFEFETTLAKKFETAFYCSSIVLWWLIATHILNQHLAH